MNVSTGELQVLAQTLLRNNNVELGDDPDSEIQVAHKLGYLLLPEELHAVYGLEQRATAAV